MKKLTPGFFCLLVALQTFAQPEDPVETLLNSLTPGAIPLDLLATKTIALYQPDFTMKELQQIQQGFERTGVDAVLYYPADLPLSNREIQKVFAEYLVKREIKYLAFLKKSSKGYEFVFTEFDKTSSMTKVGQPGWTISATTIQEISMDVYRTALNSQKRVNMLVSPTPEMGLTLRFIRGQRAEYFGLDLKVDKLAIIKFGDETWDKELEEIFKTYYPFQYTFFEPGTPEPEIRQKGYLFILHYFHTRGNAALELLGYDMAKTGSAIASVSYPNGQMQLKSNAAEEAVYKFYFKHLENGNVYLGTKWDADTSWQQALLNQIKGLKAELKIN
jgi:hypothetical protein